MPTKRSPSEALHPVKDEYRVSKKGRKGRWDDDQNKLIEESVSIWHDFACVKHKDLEGGHSVLTEWKKEEVNRLMALPAFQQLPSDVSRHSSCLLYSLLTLSLDEQHHCSLNTHTKVYQSQKP